MFFNTSSVIFLSLLPHLRFTLISRSGLSMPPLASFTSDTFVWRNYCSFICDFITALIVASVSTIALTLPPSSSVNMSTSGDLRRDRGSAQKEIIARSATSTRPIRFPDMVFFDCLFIGGFSHIFIFFHWTCVNKMVNVYKTVMNCL